ncbi:MAG: AAA family ATPase [Ferruginibacter sp.]
MNLIDNIEIKNFKSIRHQKIEGYKRVNVFIGYPNEGKSNILQALSLYGVNNIDNHSIADLVRLENPPNIFFNGDIENVASIKLNGIVEINVQYVNDGKLLVNCSEVDELGKIDKSIFKFTINKDFSFTEPMSNLNYDLNNDTSVIGNIVKYSFKKEALNEPSDDNLVLNSPFGNNLYSLIQYNSELRNEVKELLKEYSLSLIFDQGSQITKVIKNVSDENVFIISFNLLADTLLRLIFYKAAILSNKHKSTVLLFEEPEAHMFPPYISKFKGNIKYDENNNQFFIATHSPFVINDFMENLRKDDYSIYTVGYDNETGETLIRRMTDEELHEIYQ